MPTRQEVESFVRSQPGATAADMAKHFNKSQHAVSGYLKTCMVDRGFVARKPLRHLPSGQPVYGYYPVDTEGKPPKERKALAKKASAKIAVSAPGEIDKLVRTIASTLAEQIATQMMADLKQRLTATVTPLITHEESPQPPKEPEVVVQRMGKPKVCVAGLLPAQFGILTQEFGDTYDLRFWLMDMSTSVLRDFGRCCEVVFVHTNHINHGVSETLKSVKANVVNVGGGMSSIRDALTKYYVENVK